MHLFGGIGSILLIFGGIVGFYLSILRIFFNISITSKMTTFLLGTLLIIIGVQFFIFGLLADILMKIYYKNSQKTEYVIEQEL